jgi:hypothetical protein
MKPGRGFDSVSSKPEVINEGNTSLWQKIYEMSLKHQQEMAKLNEQF